MTNSLLPLVGRIEQSMEDLQAIVSRAEALVDKYHVGLDDGYLDRGHAKFAYVLFSNPFQSFHVLSRSRSVSTIILIIDSKSVSGCQLSSFLALEESPHNGSPSVSLLRDSSTCV